VGSGKKRLELEGHESKAVRISFSHSDDLIASTAWDNTVRFWDAFSGKLLLTLPGTSYQLQFSKDAHLAFAQLDDKFHLIELAAQLELARFVPSQKRNGPFTVAFSPDGRLLANANGSGVNIWDVKSGRELGFISERACRAILFAPDGESVFTCGLSGLARWTIQRKASAGALTLDVGTRTEVRPRQTLMQAALSAVGNTMVVANRDRDEAWLFMPDHPERDRLLLPHRNIQFVALSPDRRWVATGGFQGPTVNVWDASTSRKLQTLPSSDNTPVEFSRDGRWLVTAGEEYRLWHTSSWNPGPAIKLPRRNVPMGYTAFSPDSRILAVMHDRRQVYLLETESLRPMAVLETPFQLFLSSLCFSPDSMLLAAAGANGEVYGWNLPLIRHRLASMGLDWEESPFSTRRGPPMTAD
jgi:WD40 repeat protein